MGRIVKGGEAFSFSFLFSLKAVLVFSGFCSSVIWLAFSGWAQASMTWLNLLSVQPLGRTLYCFQDWPEKRTEPIL
jgi:hypothetical protein